MPFVLLLHISYSIHTLLFSRLAAQMQFRFPQFVPTPLAQIIPNASAEGLELLQDLLLYDPNQRPTASQTLQYTFFQVCVYII
ncbi:hypothetical protein EON65_33735 [archaeon]|nr:MAG: hypothetical protein EON65_33735 [archaeon]